MCEHPVSTHSCAARGREYWGRISNLTMCLTLIVTSQLICMKTDTKGRDWNEENRFILSVKYFENTDTSMNPNKNRDNPKQDHNYTQSSAFPYTSNLLGLCTRSQNHK